ncbi:MAG: hypothetical protein R3F35_22480 [Myxococcota bacterium]
MAESAAADEPMSRLEIRKGLDAALEVGGLRFVACRREVDVIDGGITLYVFDAGPEGQELLRFDLFRERPHYHAPATNPNETVISLARGERVVAWGVEQLTRRAGSFVAEAGFDALRGRLDLAAIAAAAPALRDLLEGLAEPTETSYFEVPASTLARIRS